MVFLQPAALLAVVTADRHDINPSWLRGLKLAAVTYTSTDLQLLLTDAPTHSACQS